MNDEQYIKNVCKMFVKIDYKTIFNDNHFVMGVVVVVVVVVWGGGGGH